MSSNNSNKKHLFQDILSLTKINTDPDYLTRKETYQTFLKESDTHSLIKNDFINKSHTYLSRGTDLQNFQKLHNVETSKLRKKELQNKKNHRGIMYINEIWGENHYRKIVKESNLYRKKEILDKAKNLLSIDEMLEAINTTYKKMKKFQNEDAEKVLKRFRELSNPKSSIQLLRRNTQSLIEMDLKASTSKNENQRTILDDMLKKLQTYNMCEDDYGTQLKAVFGEFIDRAINGVDVKNSKNM